MNSSIPSIDAHRLERLRDRVIVALSNGREWTLEQLKDATMGGEASVSARLRELRADGFDIRKRRAAPGSGTYLYQLVRPSRPTQLGLLETVGGR